MTAIQKLANLKAEKVLNRMGWFSVLCRSCFGGRIFSPNASETCCRACGGDGLIWEFRESKKKK